MAQNKKQPDKAKGLGTNREYSGGLGRAKQAFRVLIAYDAQHACIHQHRLLFIPDLNLDVVAYIKIPDNFFG
jgi:hypothetical protein